MRSSGLILVSLVLACGGGDKPVECQIDENCNLEAGGICQDYGPTGSKWCTYPDSTCPSGRRWSDFNTGDGLSGMCFDSTTGPDASVDAPVADAGPDASDIDGATGDSIVMVSAGNVNHTCALVGRGAVRCWGVGSGGKLGYGNTDSIGDNEHPFTAGDVDVGGTVTQITTGGTHTCALLDTGSVRCWGAGTAGQLGYGDTVTIGDSEDPSTAGNVVVGATVLQVDAGSGFTCARVTGGAVRCWGDAVYGVLGYGDLVDIGDTEDPSAAGDVAVGAPASQIAVGATHVCALTGGAVRCWGLGSGGRLGYGNNNNIGDNEDPSAAGTVTVGGTVTQIAAGGSHTCALLDTGAVRCWGSNNSGQLGYGDAAGCNGCLDGATCCIGDAETPASAGDVNVGGTVTQIAAGGSHTCALLDTGAVKCWGDGSGGRLGYGNEIDIGDDEAPASVGTVDVGGTVIAITAGATHTCALLDTGKVRCWGSGSTGQLGYGNPNDIGDNETPASAGDVMAF